MLFRIGVFTFLVMGFGGQFAEIMANIATFALVLATLLLAISWANPINIFEKPLPSEKKKLFEDTKQHTDEIARTVSSEYGLTEREQEILGHLITGRSRPRIAEILCVTENTVNSHIQHIYRKIGVHSFQELLDLIYAEQNKR